MHDDDKMHDDGDDDVSRMHDDGDDDKLREATGQPAHALFISTASATTNLPRRRRLVSITPTSTSSWRSVLDVDDVVDVVVEVGSRRRRRRRRRRGGRF